MYRLVILSLLSLLATSKVVSRNDQIKFMIKQISQSESLYNNLIDKAIIKLDDDYSQCMSIVVQANCTNQDIWEHERKKNSKNITNLKQKIESHLKTIKDVLELNSKETQHRTDILYSIMKNLKEQKNKLEKIEALQFLIKDTYLNIDEYGSVLALFSQQNTKPFEFAEIYHDSGARPGQLDYLPEQKEEIKEEKPEFNQGPPLIDEDIFDGFADSKDQINAVTQENALVADDIPQGVDIKEHDAIETEKIIEEFKQKLLEDKKNMKENYDVLNARDKYKKDVKQLGLDLYGRLERERAELEKKNSMYAQAIADLEAAIIQLHSKHGKQIIEIYIEKRKLENQIGQKIINVMEYDEKMEECKLIEKKEKQCEKNKKLQKGYIESLKEQVSVNEGILNELKKLSTFPDKNVEEEPQIQPTTPEEAQEIKEEIEKAKDEINELKNIEAEISEGLESIVPEEKKEEQIQQEGKTEEEMQPKEETEEEQPKKEEKAETEQAKEEQQPEKAEEGKEEEQPEAPKEEENQPKEEATEEAPKEEVNQESFLHKRGHNTNKSHKLLK